MSDITPEALSANHTLPLDVGAEDAGLEQAFLSHQIAPEATTETHPEPGTQVDATTLEAQRSVRSHRLARWTAGLMLAGICTLPAASLGASDAGIAEVNKVAIENIQFSTGSSVENQVLDHLAVDSIDVIAIVGISLGTGMAIKKNKSARGALADAGEFFEERSEARSAARRRRLEGSAAKRENSHSPVYRAISSAHDNARKAYYATSGFVSAAYNYPFEGLYKLGLRAEKLHDRVSESPSRVRRFLGHLATDTLWANTGSIEAVVQSKIGRNLPVSVAKMTGLGLEVAAPWVGLAEGFRALDQNVSWTQPVLDRIAQTYDLLTNMDLSNPKNVANYTVGALVLTLARSGWKLSQWQQRRDDQEQTTVPSPAAGATAEQ